MQQKPFKTVILSQSEKQNSIKGAEFMNITITARKTIVKDQFKERVEKKLAKLDRFFSDDAKATVTVTNEQERETVEVTVAAAGMFFRAEKTTSDRMDSLEAVVDSLVKQIVKNKNKLEQRLRATAFDEPMEFLPREDDEQPSLVKSKKFPVKPMSVDEAILQMNMIGHTFFMFRNGDTGEINVVYKRHDTNYGLIEPDLDAD